MRFNNLTIILALTAFVCGCSKPESPRLTEDFNFGWKYASGDSPDASPEDASRQINLIWSDAGYDDSQWRQVHIPHDWSVEEISSYEAASADARSTVGWYRKHFETPHDISAGKRVRVEFDGIFDNGTIFVNGHPVGAEHHGTGSFSFDITELLSPGGEDNIMAVRCVGSQQPDSLGHRGSGICRNIRLVTTGPARAAWNGTSVTVSQITEDQAGIAVEITIDSPSSEAVTIQNIIRNEKGSVIVRGKELSPDSTAVVDKLSIDKPELWSIDRPFIYTLETLVMVDGEASDRQTMPFAICTEEFDGKGAFLLNGDRVDLHCVSIDDNLGSLGSAVSGRAVERELETIKSAGANAIFTRHGTASPELLRLAGEMGFLVFDSDSSDICTPGISIHDFRNDTTFWRYESEWTDGTVLRIFPHWNWDKGQVVDIKGYYNNADEVELFVNGKSWGRDSKQDGSFYAQWCGVPFEPGRIEIVSYRNGHVVARDSRQTAGVPARLKLSADRTSIDADGYDLAFITVEAVDEGGREVPTASIMLQFSVSGAGELVGLENDNPDDIMPPLGNRKSMYKGKAFAVVRSLKGIPGSARLTVESNLGTEHIDIKINNIPTIKSYAKSESGQ